MNRNDTTLQNILAGLVTLIIIAGIVFMILSAADEEATLQTAKGKAYTATLPADVQKSLLRDKPVIP